MIFCFFLFNDKKMARPAGHDQLAVPAKKTLGGNAEQERSRAGTHSGTSPTRDK
ncbi:MAG: hypothetical protein FWE28_05385 [Oscillospiraceae bacterium]|nr:hypothetical protein [Oscillospiraceae bacterium]